MVQLICYRLVLKFFFVTRGECKLEVVANSKTRSNTLYCAIKYTLFVTDESLSLSARCTFQKLIETDVIKEYVCASSISGYVYLLIVIDSQFTLSK